MMLRRMIENPRSIYYILAVYILAFLVFSLFYHIVLPIAEGSSSLQYNGNLTPGLKVDNYFDCLYFSITTQTKVGYGDIVPLTTGGKITTSLQVIFGYFYLAFIIALIVARGVLKSEKFESFLMKYSERMDVH